ncbi:hypothetical protein B0H10DRAFT_2073577, partial [Mycena sp. CBHHK59/15]
MASDIPRAIPPCHALCFSIFALRPSLIAGGLVYTFSFSLLLGLLLPFMGVSFLSRDVGLELWLWSLVSFAQRICFFSRLFFLLRPAC